MLYLPMVSMLPSSASPTGRSKQPDKDPRSGVSGALGLDGPVKPGNDGWGGPVAPFAAAGGYRKPEATRLSGAAFSLRAMRLLSALT